MKAIDRIDASSGIEKTTRKGGRRRYGPKRVPLNSTVSQEVYERFKKLCETKFADRFLYLSIDEAFELFLEKYK